MKYFHFSPLYASAIPLQCQGPLTPPNPCHKMFGPPFAYRQFCAVFVIVISCAATSGANTPYPASEWLEHYYENPQPDKFVSSIFELSRNGYFELPGHTVMAMGFIATLFKENPNRVDEWLLYCRSLPAGHKRLVISALWCSGHPKGPEYIQFYAESVVGEAMAAKLFQLLESTPALDVRLIDSSRVVYLRWGEFLANGDLDSLRQILAAVGSVDTISVADRWWLARRASAHTRVVALCRAELSRQPNAIGDAMQTVIISADLAAAPSS